jgi:hypothetical protein
MITESLQFLVIATLGSIRTHLEKYKKPVLNCSFGKDSMALLHLLFSNNIRMPIVYYRDPWFPEKNAFANRIIEGWKLEVHDYPPVRTTLKHSPHMVALVSEYLIGKITTLAVLKNTIEYKDGDKRFLCGVDFLTRPCGAFVYPWDLGLIAHKDADQDNVYGPVPLHSNLVMRDDGPDSYFPFKEWSHDDIWDYTEAFGVPYDEDRYDIKNRTEWPDKTLNSDWYETCVRCVDKRRMGQIVFCPKVQNPIKNVSEAAPEFGKLPDYFSSNESL